MTTKRMVRALLLWSAAGLLHPGAVVAQLQVLPPMAYVGPAGWQVKRSDTRVDFTATTSVPGAYVMLSLYAGVPRTGDWSADFNREWQDVVLKNFEYNATPLPSLGRNRNALEYREGSADVKWVQGVVYVTLTVFGAGNQVASLLLVASDRAALKARQADVRWFVDNLRLATGSVTTAPASGAPAAGALSAPASTTARAPAPTTAAAPTPTTAPPVASSTAPAAAASMPAPTPAPTPAAVTQSAAGGSGLVGPWMSFKAYYPSYEPRPRWYTFFADGQVLEDIPREGLAGFNRERSKTELRDTGYWRTFTYNGSSGTIVNPNSRFTEALVSQGPGKMKIDSDLYTQSRPVDGVRLNGVWTSYADPNDPSLSQLPDGGRPIFRFTGDGRFVDEGVFAVFLTNPLDPSQDGAGNGTYEARDFSLILRYSDGRTRQIAFAGMLGADVATTNDIIFLGRAQFNKRK